MSREQGQPAHKWRQFQAAPRRLAPGFRRGNSRVPTVACILYAGVVQVSVAVVVAPPGLIVPQPAGLGAGKMFWHRWAGLRPDAFTSQGFSRQTPLPRHVARSRSPGHHRG